MSISLKELQARWPDTQFLTIKDSKHQVELLDLSAKIDWDDGDSYFATDQFFVKKAHVFSDFGPTWNEPHRLVAPEWATHVVIFRI